MDDHAHHHNHHNCHVTDEESQRITVEIIAQLRDTGMRKTEALEELLAVMIKSHRPFLLAELCQRPGLADRDQATIYRLVTKLKEHGVIRQLSFGDKGNFFQLNVTGHHHDYMMCHQCSQISEVPYPCILSEVEKKLESQEGWSDLSHSLSFHGLCPDCNATK